jgi:LmbE family N-acetylglucosaminyl deacetylase
MSDFVNSRLRVYDSGPILVLGAHPDDAVLGAGGLAARVTARGGRVIFCTATLGELGGDPRVRGTEDTIAARILGAELHAGRLHDGRIGLRGAITFIEASILRFNPTLVLVHYPNDSHQDHVCLSRAAVSACRFVPNLLFYEGPTSRRFWPSIVSDISVVWDKKCAALLAHRSQVSRANLMEWSDSASRFRAWPRYTGRRCEGFCPHHGDLFDLAAAFSDCGSVEGAAFASLMGQR